MDRRRVDEVFAKYADGTSHKVPSDQFPSALRDLGVAATPEKERELFTEAAIDSGSGLDRDGFFRAVNMPSELEQWCSTLPLAKLLAACLEPALASTSAAAPGREAVMKVADLPPQAIQEAVADFSAAMGRLLPERVTGLRESFSEQDRLAAAGAKFQIFTMKGLRLSGFYAFPDELIKRLGAAH